MTNNNEFNDNKKNSTNDMTKLLQMLTAFGDGNFDYACESDFENPSVAKAYNYMLEKAMDRNTRLLARINDAMIRIVDNNNLKAMFEQIENTQTAFTSFSSINNSFSDSIDTLESMNYESLSLSRQIRNSLKPTVRDMRHVLHSLQLSIDEIHNLQDSIFNISNEDPISMINSSQGIIIQLEKELISFNEVISNLSELIDMAYTIANNSDSVFSVINKQLKDSKTIFLAMASVSQSYTEISKHCYSIGGQLYRISRDIDNARNDLYRYNSLPTIHDALNVFYVDHLTLSWRLYTHVIEYETLKLGQLNNSSTCKFGIWCKEKASDPLISKSDAFKSAVNVHERLHFHAVACFEAKQNSDIKTALQNVFKALDDIEDFKNALDSLHEYLKSIGYTKETELWVFKG